MSRPRSRAVRAERAVADCKEALHEIAEGTSEHGHWWIEAANPGQLAGRVHSRCRKALTDLCDHDWQDARNKAVTSGEVCLRCGAIRARLDHEGAAPANPDRRSDNP